MPVQQRVAGRIGRVWLVKVAQAPSANGLLKTGLLLEKAVRANLRVRERSCQACLRCTALVQLSVITNRV